MHIIEQLDFAGSHLELGLSLGRRFADKIHHVFDNYGFLQDRLLPFHHSPAGRRYYQSFLKLHKTHFANYIAELEGIAQGAERPFEEIFLINLRGEYRGLMALERQSEGAGCTDCLVLTPEAALVGHNEDGPPAALGHMFAVRAQIDDQTPFTALCHPGFLPGNALGFNEAGILHTVDSVSPHPVRVGLGRHFLARSLLEARSVDDAIKRVTLPGRAAGFSYNIGSSAERSLVSVEVSPDRHHVHTVQGCYVHTNHYLNLTDSEQTIGPSSLARLTRAQAMCQTLPPAQGAHVLSVLSDETDPQYPIYRTATPPDRSATLCTALFDLESHQLRIYAGHPIREPEQYIALEL